MLACLLLLSVAAVPRPAQDTSAELTRWKRAAASVTIVRDDWGIAHVHGKTDADAVFGMIYAQAEDDFKRIERNYLVTTGRLAEAEGENAIYQDLRQRLFVNPDTTRARYAASPAWLKRLMDAWADGLNYYLRTHPEVKPKVLTRFEPWMALTFSEGSIGGDIESVSLDGLRAFYGDSAGPLAPVGLDDSAPAEPAGSNGFAVAPGNTVNHRALLLINPHTSFYFRSELQVTSDEGLRAYGAATWGQLFLYQGFNDRLGWLHSSTNTDAVDEYAETVVRRDGRLLYRYGGRERPMVTERIVVRYRTASGMADWTFTVYRTHHGPIVRADGDKWISVRLMDKPVEALSQSFLRTKARTLAEYRKVMELHANSSNNTVYADADGHIAYFHPQFIPRRDDRFDWSRPVDGSDPATEWHGVHGVEDSPHVVDPANGWIQNTNDWPWSAAGPNSPKASDFPRYMDTDVSESPRGEHAIRVLEARKDFTPERLRDAAFDAFLTAFARLVPPLVAAYDSLPAGDSLRTRLAGPIAELRAWDYRWSAGSVATSLAVFWGDAVLASARPGRTAGLTLYDYFDPVSAAERLGLLAAAVDRLARDFGSWRTPWGEINRFQRLTDEDVQPFDDAKPSVPVPFTSARWGSLASFGARTYPGTKRMYGSYGNTFVAVVEFARDSVRAMALTAGGESGDLRSRHFNDQAANYAEGRLRPVYFYPGQLAGHTERTYHPGE
jgi:acyl-homoserine-lactone acylase